MASYPECCLRPLEHPVKALEGIIAELLRVAHRHGVPLVVWSGVAATAEYPGRLVAHMHVCAACPPELGAFVTEICGCVRDGLVHAGGQPFGQHAEPKN